MASLAQRAENVPGTRQNHCAVGAELPNWARINLGGAILADFDAEKQVVALAKVLKVQDDSIKELTRRVQEAHMTTLPDEVMKKIDMLQRMFAGMRNAQEATDLERIVRGAAETVRQAGVAPSQVQTLYFTGGSTGLTPLVDRIAACFPAAQPVRGDRFASVAQGLHARAVFGAGG